MWLLSQNVQQFVAKFHSKIFQDILLKLGFSPFKENSHYKAWIYKEKKKNVKNTQESCLERT